MWAPEPPPTPAAPARDLDGSFVPPTRGEGLVEGLGARLTSATTRLVGHGGVAPGLRVLVVAAGDGVPVVGPLALGAVVTAIDADAALVARGAERLSAARWRQGRASALPVDDAAYDIVLAFFGATYDPQPSAVGRELVRAVVPGGAIAVTTWTAEAVAVLGPVGPGTAPPSTHRAERWSRYEDAQRHFHDFPGFDVVDVDAQPGHPPFAVITARRPA